MSSTYTRESCCRVAALRRGRWASDADGVASGGKASELPYTLNSRTLIPKLVPVTSADAGDVTSWADDPSRLGDPVARRPPPDPPRLPHQAMGCSAHAWATPRRAAATWRAAARAVRAA